LALLFALALTLLGAVPDAGMPVRSYRVVEEHCSSCRLEEYVPREAGVPECGRVLPWATKPRTARCVREHVDNGRPFSATEHYARWGGSQTTEAFGRSRDGGLWLVTLDAHDGSGEPCTATVTAKRCATLRLVAEEAGESAWCDATVDLDLNMACDERPDSRETLSAPAPVTAIKCAFRGDDDFRECRVDAGFGFTPARFGPDLVCIQRTTGLACAPEGTVDPPVPGWPPDGGNFSALVYGPGEAPRDGGLGAPYADVLKHIRANRWVSPAGDFGR
jgi:hypothetical protein